MTVVPFTKLGPVLTDALLELKDLFLEVERGAVSQPETDRRLAAIRATLPADGTAVRDIVFRGLKNFAAGEDDYLSVSALELSGAGVYALALDEYMRRCGCLEFLIPPAAPLGEFAVTLHHCGWGIENYYSFGDEDLDHAGVIFSR